MIWRQQGLDGEAAFESMQAAFERALSAHPECLWETTYIFAGRPAHVRIMGLELAKLISPAFSHLHSQHVGTSTLRLGIDLWDESQFAVSRPTGSAGLEDDGEYRDRDYCLVMGALGDRFVGCQRSDVLTWSDRVGRHIVGCAVRSERLSVHEQAKPLHFPLLLWHNDQGVEVIHAGLVSKDGRGVLLAGKGNTGKTTVALACLGAGFNFLADDYIGLQALDDGSFCGHSLYSSTWLEPDHAARFPHLVPHVMGREDPEFHKISIILSRVLPNQLARVAPINLVLLPRLVDRTGSRIRSASRGEALLAVAPSSLLQLPISRALSLNKLADLVEHVPCYWLELGHDLESIPRCVDEILAEVS